MLTVSFEDLLLGTALQLSSGKDLLIPLSTTDTANGSVSYSVTNNSNSGLFATSLITSGTLSPSIDRGIGMGYIPV